MPRSESRTRRSRCDVAIIGAGPAGCAAALRLRELGADVTIVVGPARPEALGITETLAPEVNGAIQKLGLHSQFAATFAHAQAQGLAARWGQDLVAVHDFLCSPFGFGWHVDRARLNAFLQAQVRSPGGTCIAGRLRGAELSPGGYELQIVSTEDDLETVQARWVVDATGRQAAFARRFGGACRRTFHPLIALYGLLEGSEPRRFAPAGFALVESVEAGWWYSAPATEGRLSVGFFTDPDHCHTARLRDVRRWRRQLGLTVLTRQRIPAGSRLIAGPIAVPAGSSALTEACGQRWVAAGDAACAYDPLSGQGVLHALGSGIEVAERVSRSLNGGDGLDRYAESTCTRLERYLERHRQHYSAERRWLHAPFWARRRGPPPSGACADQMPSGFLRGEARA